MFCNIVCKDTGHGITDNFICITGGYSTNISSFGNDKLIIDLMKEMKSFEILRTEIGKIIDLGQNADSLNI